MADVSQRSFCGVWAVASTEALDGSCVEGEVFTIIGESA